MFRNISFFNSMFKKHNNYSKIQISSIHRNNKIFNNPSINTVKCNNPYVKKDNTEYKILKSENNVIDIKEGCYRVKTKMHGYMDIRFDKDRSLYPVIPQDIENGTRKLSQYEQEDRSITSNFFGSFVGKTTDEFLHLLRVFVPETKETIPRFQSLGINPGEFFQIKSYPDKLFLDGTNGWVYKESDIESLRQGYNRTNYAKDWGCTKNTKFMIDGNEYHLDDTGHLNLPKGVICIPSRVEIIY